MESLPLSIPGVAKTDEDTYHCESTVESLPLSVAAPSAATFIMDESVASAPPSEYLKGSIAELPSVSSIGSFGSARRNNTRGQGRGRGMKSSATTTEDDVISEEASVETSAPTVATLLTTESPPPRRPPQRRFYQELPSPRSDDYGDDAFENESF